jgi:hypothetical protein
MSKRNSSAEPAYISDVGSDKIAAWASFLRYMKRSCSDDYLTVNLSLLVRSDIPLAWRIRSDSHAPFYVDVDGGDTDKQWEAFLRHLLSRCIDMKRGYGIIRLDHLLIHHKRPLMWAEATLIHIHPSSLATSPNGDDMAMAHFYATYLRAI